MAAAAKISKLVATGKANILPDGKLAGAGDGCQVDAG